MQAKARAVSDKQGGTYREGSTGQVKGEVFDKNRGSDHGGNNSPKMKEGY